MLEGDRRFNLVGRWKPEYRETIEAMRNIHVNVPTGGNVPLGQIARVEASEGARHSSTAATYSATCRCASR